MATPHTLPDTSSNPPNGQVPPLENGDRLSRAEFERRYDAMPHLKKAELIEGVVHLPSPVRLRSQGRPHAHLIGWLVHFEAHTLGVETGDNSTTRLDLANEPQPDAVLFIDPQRGGQARLSPDDYLEAAPELHLEELTGPLFGLGDYRDAIEYAMSAGRLGAVKVAFDLRGLRG